MEAAQRRVAIAAQSEDGSESGHSAEKTPQAQLEEVEEEEEEAFEDTAAHSPEHKVAKGQLEREVREEKTQGPVTASAAAAKVAKSHVMRKRRRGVGRKAKRSAQSKKRGKKRKPLNRGGKKGTKRLNARGKSRLKKRRNVGGKVVRRGKGKKANSPKLEQSDAAPAIVLSADTSEEEDKEEKARVKPKSAR